MNYETRKVHKDFYIHVEEYEKNRFIIYIRDYKTGIMVGKLHHSKSLYCAKVKANAIEQELYRRNIILDYGKIIKLLNN